MACADNGKGEEPGGDQAASPSTIQVSVKDSFEKGKVISTGVCKLNASQSYALYIPSNATNTSLPVVYFFDPHGNGGLPLNKYKTLADRYGFILVGSNNSKNGNDLTVSAAIWNVLLTDTKERLKINSDRIYLCGFSGGAKVASYIGLTHPEVKAVIANGAGLADVTQNSFHFSFTAIAGEGDMNMTDLVSINDELNKTNVRHRLILFDGKHEWAPEPRWTSLAVCNSMLCWQNWFHR
jgi:predicted peptidase